MVTCVAGDVRLIARSEGEVPCAMESHSALRQFKASISVNNVISDSSQYTRACIVASQVSDHAYVVKAGVRSFIVQ